MTYLAAVMWTGGIQTADIMSLMSRAMLCFGGEILQYFHIQYHRVCYLPPSDVHPPPFAWLAHCLISIEFARTSPPNVSNVIMPLLGEISMLGQHFWGTTGLTAYWFDCWTAGQ